MAIAMYRNREPIRRQVLQTGLLLLAFIGLGLLGWRLIRVFGLLVVIGTPLFYWLRDKK
jgi:hypothetical protein